MEAGWPHVDDGGVAMSVAIVVVFVLGTIGTFLRTVLPWRKSHPSNGLGFNIAYWLFVAFSSLMTGAIASVLVVVVVVAEPIVSFVQRVDALERRCPPDTTESR